MQQKWVEQEDSLRSPNHLTRKAAFTSTTGLMTGMNESRCFGVGMKDISKCSAQTTTIVSQMG